MAVTFAEAIESGDIEAIRAFPKADKHCHSIFGARLEHVEAWAGRQIERPPAVMDGLAGMADYIISTLNPVMNNRPGFEFSARTAIADAVADGVVLLEMSVGISFAHFYEGGLPALTAFLSQLLAAAPEQLDIRLELGMRRRRCVGPARAANHRSGHRKRRIHRN